VGTILKALAACVGGLLADELRAWLPWMTEHLVRCAVRILPENQRERYAEEWRSYLVGFPGGQLSRLVAALDLIRAAYVISDLRLVEGFFVRLGSLILLILLGPGILLVQLCIKVTLGRGPTLGRCRIIVSDCAVDTYAFRVLENHSARWLPYVALHHRFRMTPITQDERNQLHQIFAVCYQRSVDSLNRNEFSRFLIETGLFRYPSLINVVRGDIPNKHLKEFLSFIG
jgi:hypothetical protein